MGNDKEFSDVSKIFKSIGRKVMKQTGAVHADAGIAGKFGFLRFNYGCSPTKYLHLCAIPCGDSYGVIALSGVLDKGGICYLTNEEHDRIFTKDSKMYDGGAYWLLGQDITSMEDEKLPELLTTKCEKDIIFDSALIATRKLVTDCISLYVYAKEANMQIKVDEVISSIMSTCKNILKMDKMAMKELSKFEDGSACYLLNVGKEENGQRTVKRLLLNAVESPDSKYLVLYYLSPNGQRRELPDKMGDVAALFQAM